MWGNRMGWMISAGIVVVWIGIMAMMIFGVGPTPPTALTTSPGAMDPIVLPGNPRALVPVGSGDGTAFYTQAIDAYNADPSAYNPDLVTKAKLSAADLKKMSAMELLIQASDAGKGTVFATRPETIVCYGLPQHKGIEAAYNLGRYANGLGQRLKIAKPTPRPQEAKKYFIAAFNLGFAMCSERLVYMEFYRGQELMQNAVLGLADVETENASELKAWPPQMKDLIDDKQSRFVQIHNAMNMFDKAAIERNAGDVYNLAKNSQERMWRIEAILAVGHFRYNAVNPGDQRAVGKFLDQLAASDSLDGPTKAAIKAAQNLTEAQHNTSAQMP
jgi:hypothetical protein